MFYIGELIRSGDRFWACISETDAKTLFEAMHLAERKRIHLSTQIAVYKEYKGIYWPLMEQESWDVPWREPEIEFDSIVTRSETESLVA